MILDCPSLLGLHTCQFTSDAVVAEGVVQRQQHSWTLPKHAVRVPKAGRVEKRPVRRFGRRYEIRGATDESKTGPGADILRLEDVVGVTGKRNEKQSKQEELAAAVVYAVNEKGVAGWYRKVEEVEEPDDAEEIDVTHTSDAPDAQQGQKTDQQTLAVSLTPVKMLHRVRLFPYTRKEIQQHLADKARSGGQLGENNNNSLQPTKKKKGSSGSNLTLPDAAPKNQRKRSPGSIVVVLY